MDGFEQLFDQDMKEREDKTTAYFTVETFVDAEESAKTGEVVTKDVEMVHIRPPGKPMEKFQANNLHRQRFPREYGVYNESKDRRVEGTPIDQWSSISASKALRLKYAGIITVEQLADWNLTKNPLQTDDEVALVIMARDFVKGESAKDRKIAELEKRLAQESRSNKKAG